MNHDDASIAGVAARLQDMGLPAKVMVDCSHGNSQKDFRRQPDVARSLAEQVAGGSTAIMGVMLESHLVEGRQDLVEGSPLTYGQSITDACISLEDTVPVLESLAEAVRKRRKGSKS